jgi:hypothetical protein
LVWLDSFCITTNRVERCLVAIPYELRAENAIYGRNRLDEVLGVVTSQVEWKTANSLMEWGSEIVGGTDDCTIFPHKELYGLSLPAGNCGSV